jgi:hypothetical protein
MVFTYFYLQPTELRVIFNSVQKETDFLTGEMGITSYSGLQGKFIFREVYEKLSSISNFYEDNFNNFMQERKQFL